MICFLRISRAQSDTPDFQRPYCAVQRSNTHYNPRLFHHVPRDISPLLPKPNTASQCLQQLSPALLCGPGPSPDRPAACKSRPSDSSLQHAPSRHRARSSPLTPTRTTRTMRRASRSSLPGTPLPCVRSQREHGGLPKRGEGGTCCAAANGAIGLQQANWRLPSDTKRNSRRSRTSSSFSATSTTPSPTISYPLHQ